MNKVLHKENCKPRYPETFMIYDNETSDSKDIAEEFNNFFTNIGKKINDNIPPADTHFSNYLQEKNSESFFIDQHICLV